MPEPRRFGVTHALGAGVRLEVIEADHYRLDHEQADFFAAGGEQVGSFTGTYSVVADGPAEPIMDQVRQIADRLGEELVPVSAVREALDVMLKLARDMDGETTPARRHSLYANATGADRVATRLPENIMHTMAAIGPLMADIYADALEHRLGVEWQHADRWWRDPHSVPPLPVRDDGTVIVRPGGLREASGVFVPPAEESSRV